ncbi:UDP-N-acetylmuramate:L-alanyl-gamma-D-glutamyl-meso-diaminopimelate ligase [Thermithiobacillus tepidarius DSM 3134]|uniref:UDP-N-acetylmuramate:L-alanyl-gamma-D-glutamyl- meso-diaminopimelate ligase n=1 Tax=Thermithiobacillus tepidarius TaxID=929 RepID=UPI0004040A91|nr:UDP-N-acetylmuramate:L-alanyl-gamma-D-glutamyl-meso-diaminopimelate ligase [Thermithiobacillus tepidarius]
MAHIHILGICGTFMGGIAVLAQQAGHRVTGSDANVYPPMSTFLESQGIALMEGYRPENLEPRPDLVVVGNAISRGNAEIEAVLNLGLPYVSGPEWLARHYLVGKWVLAVAGTHGKTSTSSMLAWVLEDAGLNPGFLIGGLPENFGVSARNTDSPFFVVEADEYDTAFFDKRAKFVHYRPRTAILNNLEYDHADIYPDLAAIQTQFHHLVRTVPGNGLIVANGADPHLAEVLARGCWTPVEHFGQGKWTAELLAADGSRFRVLEDGRAVAEVHWELLGTHNVHNALAVIAAARHADVPVAASAQALGRFRNVKRRLELRGEVNGVRVYDDFAHHPTAIVTTLAGLRARVGEARIIAVLEPRSNTMRLGVHKDSLGPSLRGADAAFVYAPADLGWDATGSLAGQARVHADLDGLQAALLAELRPGDHVLIMSNGGFGGLHERLLAALRAREP